MNDDIPGRRAYRTVSPDAPEKRASPIWWLLASCVGAFLMFCFFKGAQDKEMVNYLLNRFWGAE